MAKKTVQRITLQMADNPVKWAATITDADPKGAWIFVEFDGPLPSQCLYRRTGTSFINMKLDEFQSPSNFPDCVFWKVV